MTAIISATMPTNSAKPGPTQGDGFEGDGPEGDGLAGGPAGMLRAAPGEPPGGASEAGLPRVGRGEDITVADALRGSIRLGTGRGGKRAGVS
ncbi:hypothetical protein BV511_16485 [Methylorubrum extorquens]|nr:hypothetical protein BV511_16485 [Methylorubrum extorquens]